MKAINIFFILGLLLVSGIVFSEGAPCETSDDCEGWEYCGSINTCIQVVGGMCGYVTNHAFVEYECCWDDECAAGELCLNNTCMEKEEPQDITGAEEAINNATDAISEAQVKEWNTEAAAEKLLEAQEAYEAGEYNLAKSLAEEAIALIEEPEAGPSDDGGAGEGKDIVVQDLSWLLYIAAAVILAAIYFLLKRKKKKK